MKLSNLANSRILDQPIYQPGKPIEQVAEEYGLPPDQICKLASNENPWGPSPSALEGARQALKKVRLYPDGSGHALVDSLSSLHGLSPEQFVLGNGSNEIIELLAHVFIEPGDQVVCGAHAFVVYKLVTLLMGGIPVEVEMPDLRHDLNRMREAVGDRTKLVFLPSPNNPTGTANSQEEILSFVRSLPDHLVFCFDEAYAEYLDSPPDLRPLIEEGRKVICLRTFSKIHGLAGLRIGYGYASAELISLLQRARQPFNANAVGQAAALGALSDPDWVEQCRRRNLEGLKQLQTGLTCLGIDFVPSQANFVLAKTGDGMRMFADLQKQGIITRPLGSGLESYLRLSVGTADENERLLNAMEKAQALFVARS